MFGEIHLSPLNTDGSVCPTFAKRLSSWSKDAALQQIATSLDALPRLLRNSIVTMLSNFSPSSTVNPQASKEPAVLHVRYWKHHWILSGVCSADCQHTCHNHHFLLFDLHSLVQWNIPISNLLPSPVLLSALHSLARMCHLKQGELTVICEADKLLWLRASLLAHHPACGFCVVSWGQKPHPVVVEPDQVPEHQHLHRKPAFTNYRSGSLSCCD